MPTLQKSHAKTVDEIGGRERPKEGFYHVAISHWDETLTAKDAILVDYQILAGTTPGEEGKSHRETMNLKRKSGEDNSDVVRRVLVAAGIIGPGDPIDRDVTNEIAGRQVIVRLAEREYEKDGKKHKAVNVADFGCAVWPIGHPDVAHVPLYQAALALRGGSIATPPRPQGGSVWDSV